MNSKLDFRLKKDKVSMVIKKPNCYACSRNVTWHIHKQTICLQSETHWKLLLYLDFCSFFGKYWPKLLQCSTIFAFAAPWYLQDKLLMIHRVNIISQISLSCMKHDSTPKIVAWKHKCWVMSRRIPTRSARYIASNKCMDQARLLSTKTARDKIINCFCKEWYRLNIHGPFPHYAPVSKDKEVRTRLGWTISYKSPHFVHPSLELMALFTGIRERSIGLDRHLKDRRHVFKPIGSFQYYPIAVNNIVVYPLKTKSQTSRWDSIL